MFNTPLSIVFFLVGEIITFTKYNAPVTIEKEMFIHLPHDKHYIKEHTGFD